MNTITRYYCAFFLLAMVFLVGWRAPHSQWIECKRVDGSFTCTFTLPQCPHVISPSNTDLSLCPPAYSPQHDLPAFVAAVKQADVDTTHCYLAHGANPNQIDSTGRSVFAIALDQLYIPNKYDTPSTPSYTNLSSFAEEMCQSLTLQRKRTQTITLLLQHGGDPNTGVIHGNTALLLALDNFKPKIATLFIEYGADVQSQEMGESGWYALTSAVVNEYTDVVKLLIQKGADINEKGTFGFTPLMQAAKRAHYDILKILLEHGADIHARDDHGNTAFIKTVDWASMWYRNKPTTEAECQNVTNTLLLEKWKSYSQVFELLIKYGTDIHAKNHDGDTAFSLAKKFPELEKVLTQIIEQGGSIKTD